ncbi:MAG: phosphomethylpyrimidine synthase ThiC [Deltaproteobacteria bacterium]|nr:phosphomethylpyrimidine synthase ThiC [Deltaproteobacteria bacterium]
MTQIEQARQGIITEEMRKAALSEGVTADFIREGIAGGNIVVCKNKLHNIAPLAIGKGLRTKINANIGTSGDSADLSVELEKLRVAVKAGADAVMDLSTGGDIDDIRKEIIKESAVIIGTVPIYSAVVELNRKGKVFTEMTAEDLFRAIEDHAKDGVDFITVHCGVTRSTIERLNNEGRLMDIVSRGGSMLAAWMAKNGKENPLYEQYDRLLDIAREYELVLSLGDGLRPGSIADATDRSQIHELIILGELTQRAWDKGVQVMVEGPGHVPIDQIEANILLQKRLCHGAPFYVLGPLVTDIAPGYDHITSAIGGAIAAKAGADFLCYVTPSEHLRLPDIEDVREGVIASRIAAHAGDIAKGIKGAMERDIQMSKYRRALDWEGQIKTSIDPEKARRLRESAKPTESDVCTMCAALCAIKVSSERC